MINSYFKTTLTILFLLSTTEFYSQEIVNNSIRPGEVWPDTDGNHINAHGGGIVFHDGVYYWFGEARLPVEWETGSRATKFRKSGKGSPVIRWHPEWNPHTYR
ncbi:MAG: hypothetical protein K0B05_00545 [Bacteroidales bacterium]|nr:hypothetical protein [Bacteroidales bacterium]